MAYIDGSHQFEDVLLDFVYTHEMLEIGGLILFDDATNSQISKALRFLEGNYPEIYEPVSLAKLKSGRKAQAKHLLAECCVKLNFGLIARLRMVDKIGGKQEILSVVIAGGTYFPICPTVR